MEGFGVVWDLNLEVKRSALSGYEITCESDAEFRSALRQNSEVPFKLGCQIHRKPERKGAMTNEEADLYLFPLKK